MYSLILMTAMAGTPDVASFGWENGGCYGSCGGISVGCSGYAPAACYGCGGYGCGYSCGGYGGPRFPRAAAVARFTARATVGTLATVLRPFSGYGHSSSCYGSACYGSSCYGSSSPGSSYYGSAAYGGCYGTGYSTGGIGYASMEAPMNYGGAVFFGSSHGVMIGEAESFPMNYAQVPTFTNTVVAAKPVEMPTPTVANISIELPANAKLFVDGQLISGSGEKRQFHTPALPKGQAYYYDVKAEIDVNGKTEVEEKRVVLKAGDELKESFPKLFAAIRASSPTSVASK